MGHRFPRCSGCRVRSPSKAVGRLEASRGDARPHAQPGGGPELRTEYAAASDRYVAARNKLGDAVPRDDSAGGMPVRVKCLHAVRAPPGDARQPDQRGSPSASSRCRVPLRASPSRTPDARRGRRCRHELSAAAGRRTGGGRRPAPPGTADHHAPGRRRRRHRPPERRRVGAHAVVHRQVRGPLGGAGRRAHPHPARRQRCATPPTETASSTAYGRAGVEAEVLSGDAEARTSFLGATAGTGGAACTVVLDIGGGSTEFILGSSAPEAMTSRQLGCVRLTERAMTSDPPSSQDLLGALTVVDAELGAVEALRSAPCEHAHRRRRHHDDGRRAAPRLSDLRGRCDPPRLRSGRRRCAASRMSWRP